MAEVVEKRKTRLNYPTVLNGRPLKVLSVEQIHQIDDALAELGPFAEVKLIKAKGKLRFLQKIESESMV